MRNEMNMNACHCDWWKEMEMYAKVNVCLWHEDKCNESENEMRNDMMFEMRMEWKCMQKWMCAYDMRINAMEKRNKIWNNMMFEMRMEWLWYDNVCMCYENEKWNENGNEIWKVDWNRMEWLWHDNVNMCAMTCMYVQWKWEMYWWNMTLWNVGNWC